jgi:hypothetical protein
MKEYFEGPLVVATELFSNLKALSSLEQNEIVLTDLDRNKKPFSHSMTKTIKTKRVGLSAKLGDVDNYYKNLPIRYIIIVPQFSKSQKAIKGIEGLLGEQVIDGKMTINEARKLLGYN